MKKTLISLAILTAVSTASALDFGAGYSRNTTTDVNGYGLSATQSWGPVSLTAAVDRFDAVGGVHDYISVLAGYTVAKIWGVSVDGQFGASYVHAESAVDGLTSVFGLGASLPLTKSMSLTGDVRRTLGGGSMKVHDGTTVGVGLKYSF
jgi:hypothetical protein